MAQIKISSYRISHLSRALIMLKLRMVLERAVSLRGISLVLSDPGILALVARNFRIVDARGLPLPQLHLVLLQVFL